MSYAIASVQTGFYGNAHGCRKKKAEQESCVSTADPSAVWFIPTNEELLIARDTRDIVSAF